MNELNLPAFDVKIRGTRERPEIYDFLRRRYVALTPEEWVRQHFVHWLVEQKGYPKGLLGNEVALKCGDKTLRCDSILYNKEAKPQMIIEYKAPTVAVTQRVFNQITAYNTTAARWITSTRATYSSTTSPPTPSCKPGRMMA